MGSIYTFILLPYKHKISKVYVRQHARHKCYGEIKHGTQVWNQSCLYKLESHWEGEVRVKIRLKNGNLERWQLSEEQMMLNEGDGASSVENSSQLLRLLTAAETVGEKEKSIKR